MIFQSDHGYNIWHHGIHTKGNGDAIFGGVNGPKRPNMWDISRIPLLIRLTGLASSASGWLGLDCNRTEMYVDDMLERHELKLR